MKREEVLKLIKEIMQSTDYSVIERYPSNVQRTHLVATSNDKIFIIDLLMDKETIQSDIAAATFRVSQLKQPFGDLWLKMEPNHILIVTFDPDGKSFLQLEAARRDLSVTRRRVIIVGSPEREGFRNQLEEKLRMLTVQQYTEKRAEIESPLDRLAAHIDNPESKKLVEAFKNGGASGLRRELATKTEASE